ncbi:hypothetical protein BGZ98_003972 [Dissophora globulifera]|nr:hypothetical protein BGZ98_003972 [Dissophora globulifera]
MTAHTNTSAGSTAPAVAIAHDDIHLINVTSPEIIRRTWENNYDEWGTAYNLDTYVARETLLGSQDFTNNGKMKFWVLVPKTFDPTHPDLDLILSSLETFERPGIVATKDEGIKDVISVSIGSVFTPARHRRHGYASLMMKQLWNKIQEMDNVSFTFLFSDVGPHFYGRFGWKALRSEEMVVPATHSLGVAAADGPSVTLASVTDQDLPALVARDAQLLQESLQEQLNKPTHLDKTSWVAVAPNVDCIQWLHARARYTAKHGLNLQEDAAKFKSLGAKDVQSDSFVLWYHDLLHKQLYVIRWRVAPSAGEETARAMMEAAQAEAQKWKLDKVLIWNPDQELVRLVGVEIKHREDSISCLGLTDRTQEADSNVEWVMNEKYAWC